MVSASQVEAECGSGQRKCKNQTIEILKQDLILNKWRDKVSAKKKKFYSTIQSEQSKVCENVLLSVDRNILQCMRLTTFWYMNVT